jgi:hypothetical protein
VFDGIIELARREGDGVKDCEDMSIRLNSTSVSTLSHSDAKFMPTVLGNLSSPLLSSPLSSEVLLLLNCLCPLPLDGENLEHLFPANLDWSALFSLAEKHCVYPLLAYRLQELNLPHLPVWVKAQLATRLQLSACRGLALLALLRKLWQRFEVAGIVATTFKGSAFAHIIYGNLALRESVDLDLLVPLSQVAIAKQLLISEGFVPQVDLTPLQLIAYTHDFHALTFIHPESGLIVDLHWSILVPKYSFCPPPEFVWKHLVSISLPGQVVTTLRPECLLLFICAHSAKEDWYRVRFMTDIAHLLTRHSNLDWAWVWAHMGQVGNVRMLKLGLYLADGLLGVALPAEAWAQINTDPQVPILAKKVTESLFPVLVNEPEISKRQNGLPLYPLFWQSLDCWQDQLQFVRKYFIPTLVEYRLVQLPSQLLFLYYPLRVIRLTWKHGSKLLLPKLRSMVMRFMVK